MFEKFYMHVCVIVTKFCCLWHYTNVFVLNLIVVKYVTFWSYVMYLSCMQLAYLSRYEKY